MVFGTRPEAIKMAPLAHALLADQEFDFKLCVTAQHRGMLDQANNMFNLAPDFDLNLMKPGQDLSELSSDILKKIKEVLEICKPDILLVHGDTTTSFISSLAAYYHRIPVGHIEAGLRTNCILSPWPEEGNRRMTACLAKFHFAPTEYAKANLIRENISADDICVTGNTVIDALKWMSSKIQSNKFFGDEILRQIKSAGFDCETPRRLVLITGHRRENFGENFKQICESIKYLAQKNSDVDFVYPVHLNPNVRAPVFGILTGLSNVYLTEPFDYASFVMLMMRSSMILTDSGGIQEEGPFLGKPVLVMRDTTERPEALKSNGCKLVGTKKEEIIIGVQGVLDCEGFKNIGNESSSIFGDGHACERIIHFLHKRL